VRIKHAVVLLMDMAVGLWYSKYNEKCHKSVLGCNTLQISNTCTTCTPNLAHN